MWDYELQTDLFKRDGKASPEFHVDYLRSQFQDFARANLYRVVFNIEPNSKNNDKLHTELLAKAVNFPAFEMSKLEIKRMGEKFYLPASQSYGDLQLTVLSDDAYTPRRFLHAWLHDNNYSAEENVFRKNSNLSKSSVTVYQLDNKMNAIFGANFTHCFPSSIGEIQMSYDSADQLTEFPVTFSYSQYQILTPTELDSGNV
jgi:hypothetical protein